MDRSLRRALRRRTSQTHPGHVTSTAIHEAGHAVAAVATGFVVLSLTIVPNSRHKGELKWQSADTFVNSQGKLVSKTHIANMLIRDFAGLAAERAYGFDTSGKKHGGGDLDDIRMVIKKFAAQNPKADITRILDVCELLARRTMEANLAVTTKLAKSLMVHKTLSGSAVTKICDGASLPPEVARVMATMMEEGVVPTIDEVKDLFGYTSDQDYG